MVQRMNYEWSEVSERFNNTLKVIAYIKPRDIYTDEEGYLQKFCLCKKKGLDASCCIMNTVKQKHPFDMYCNPSAKKLCDSLSDLAMKNNFRMTAKSRFFDLTL